MSQNSSHATQDHDVMVSAENVEVAQKTAGASQSSGKRYTRLELFFLTSRVAEGVWITGVLFHLGFDTKVCLFAGSILPKTLIGLVRLEWRKKGESTTYR